MGSIQQVLDSFTGREVASAIWLVIALAWAISIQSIRHSLGGIVESLRKWKVLVPIVFLVGWTIGVVFVCAQLGLWNFGLLKDTVLVFMTAILPGLFDFPKTGEGADSLFHQIRHQVGLVAVVEYVFSAYTFSLPVELILQPVLLAIFLPLVVAEGRQECEVAAKFLRRIALLCGTVIVSSTVWMVVGDTSLSHLSTGAASFLALTLVAVMGLPAIRAVHVLAGYEGLFLQLKWQSRRGRDLGPRETFGIIREVGVDLVRIAEARRRVAVGLPIGASDERQGR